MKKECFVFTSDENKYGSIYKVLLNDIISRDNIFYIEKTFIKVTNSAKTISKNGLLYKSSESIKRLTNNIFDGSRKSV